MPALMSLSVDSSAFLKDSWLPFMAKHQFKQRLPGLSKLSKIIKRLKILALALVECSDKNPRNAIQKEDQETG